MLRKKISFKQQGKGSNIERINDLLLRDCISFLVQLFVNTYSYTLSVVYFSPQILPVFYESILLTFSNAFRMYRDISG